MNHFDLMDDDVAHKGALNRVSPFWRACFVVLLVVLLFWVWYAHRHKPKAAIPVSVVVQAAHRQDVPIYISALGNVTATYTVTLKTQINGLLMKVDFKEGQLVKKGQVLAEIDDRLLKAQLIQYEGQLIRDQALLDNALIDLKRYQILWKQDSVSQQTLATQIALVKQYQGSVEMDKGLVQSTHVNLLYCHIIAPVDGRIGLRLVDPGNFVQTSDTSGMAVITTLNPTTVIFSIPEDYIQEVISGAQVKHTVLVDAYDRLENKILAKGGMVTMDNLVNTATGTVKLRAKFNNKNNTLFPNQFVNIRMLVNTLSKVTVIPTAAIQHGNQGDFVYQLTAKSTVKIIPIKVGVTRGESTVVTQGVSPGQKVVTEGTDQLTDGAKVSVV